MKVTRLDTAHILCKNSILTQGGDPEQSTLIGCFAWLAEREGEYILIDCGIEDLATVNRTKSSKDDWARAPREGSVLDQLAGLGIRAEQISKVLLTHSHYDHISQLPAFSRACVYMSGREWDYLRRDNPHKPWLANVITFLEEKKAEGKLILIGSNYEEGDLRCTLVGGHTPGSMIVRLEDCLFTGDAVFLAENIQKGLPIGFCADPEGARAAVELCAKHLGPVFTGHDVTCPIIYEI